MTSSRANALPCPHDITPRADDAVNDLLELAERLAEQRDAPPASLPRHWARDGPTKDQQPIPAPKRGTGAHGNAQSHSWNWKSKGT
jgi:hypothetical protein